MATSAPQSSWWQGLHDALGGERLPPARAIGVKMKLHHRKIERGKWAGEIVFEKGAANSFGIIHGGFLASILDIAMGYASLTLLGADESQRTLEMKINFLSGVPPDSVLADGEVLRRGRRTTYCEGSVRTRNGVLVARASATFAIGEPRLNSEGFEGHREAVPLESRRPSEERSREAASTARGQRRQPKRKNK